MADGPITLDASEVEEAPTLDASQVEESAPKQYLPEVNQAVASVQRPSVPAGLQPSAPPAPRAPLPNPRLVQARAASGAGTGGLLEAAVTGNGGGEAIPDAAVPALQTAKKVLVDPFNKIAAGTSAAGGTVAENLAGRALVRGNEPQAVPITPKVNPRLAMAESATGAFAPPAPSGPPMPTEAKDIVGHLAPFTNAERDKLFDARFAAQEAADPLSKPRAEYPITMAVAKGVGETVGGIVGDPRYLPFFGSSLARPALARLISAGFTAQMGIGTAQGAKELYQNWDQMKPAERAELATKTGITALFLAHGTIKTGGGYEALPKEPIARAESLFRNLIYKAGGTVPENPTFEQANAAYRAAMNNLHPDVNPATAEDAQNLNAAWATMKTAGSFAQAPPVPTPTRNELAEHLDRTHFESGDAARASYVAEKQAQEPVGEAKPKAPEAEVIPPPKPAPAVKESPAVPVLEANQVEESPKPATVSPKESRPPQGAKSTAVAKPAAEPVSKPAAESAPVVAKPGVEETAATPSKEQPAEKPEIVKGGKVELPDGRRATIEYAAPADKLPVVRLSTEDGEKVKLTSQKEIDGLKAATKYKYGSTQADIPESSEAHSSLEAARARISDSDLAGKGKDVGGNHVTVRYGIQSEDVEGVKKYLASLAPFEASLGKTDKFPPTPNSDGAAVIHAPIESPELQKINAELEKHGDFTEPSFKEYRPHATIAYVDPAKAGRYTGMSVTEGKKFPVNEIAITDKNGGQAVVKLEGKKEPARTPTGRLLTPEELDVQNQPGTTGVAKDVDKWQPPPELGAFPNTPDVGAKARAQVDKESGPLKRGEERRKVDRTGQQEEDRLFTQARKELGEDATTEQIEKRIQELRKPAAPDFREQAKNDLKGFLRREPTEAEIAQRAKYLETKGRVIPVQFEEHEITPTKAGLVGKTIEPAKASLSDHLRDKIAAGEMPKDNPALKKIIDAFDGKPAEPARMKQAQEALEVAIVQHARGIVESGGDTRGTFDSLVKLYESQPNLNVRTSTSIENQAYSTPAPLAFLAGKLAGVGKNTRLYEPTAGNGMLTIGATPKNVRVNELNPERMAALQKQGFSEVTQRDAAEPWGAEHKATLGKAYDAVVTNPPFGSVKDSKGNPIKERVDGYKIGQIDHLIAARALDAMKDKGKATLILGANKFTPGGQSSDDSIFLNWLYSHYNVSSHFEVEGRLYGRQGAAWPVRVITIDGRQQSSGIAPEVGSIQRATTWPEVYDQFSKSLAAQSSRPPRERGADSSLQRTSESEPTAVRTQPRATPEGVSRQESKPGAGVTEQQPRTPSRSVRDSNAERPEGLPVSDPAVRPDADVAKSDRLEKGHKAPIEPERTPDTGKPDRSPRTVTAPANEFQVPYVPASGKKDAGVLIPVNMRQPLEQAMNALEDQVGDLDKFVQKELGYASKNDLHDAFMGLQVDSITAAIQQMRNGRAVVIADQTGIGKGRQAAGIIRWAAKQGYIPVFVTKAPSLFTDMYGDLSDIGTDDVKPFIVNADEWITLPDGSRAFANKPATHRRTLEQIRNTGKLPEGRNAVFLTYSQVNMESNLQQGVLRAISSNSVFILDESHNAGGDSNTGEYMRNLIGPARGVTYLSATYAKRPDNMPLYYKTDMGEAIGDSGTLVQAMKDGGLPLQTVVSNNLVKAGQMFRRERSYDGVKMATKVITAQRKEHSRLADATTEALRAIVEADKEFHSTYVAHAQEQARKENKANKISGGGNEASKSVHHTEFSSVVHNFVRQMLLGIKADEAADQAIETLKRGEKPLIAVDNTMGSFLHAYVGDHGIRPGDHLEDFDYRTVLSRALERSRYLSIKNAQGDVAKEYVPLEKLDPATREVYDRAQKTIDKLKIETPVSPIDWIRHRIEDAGYSVSEITGRNLSVDYSEPDKPKLATVPIQEQRDKVETTRRFNDGRLDAIILNVSGSTGISLHASEKFSDQRARHMIVVQPAQDINIFMQMLGRIHRTGQVKLPGYTILNADLPAEKRPSALLSKKMKSLNANTSSNAGSATSVKAADMMNKYGDQIIGNYLEDNPRLAEMLGLDGTDDNGDSIPDIARKATGRLAILPVKVQEEFYRDVEQQYHDYIAYLDSTNQNELEPKTHDYDAKELRTDTLVEATNPNTPFGESAVYGEYSIKSQGKPLTPEEVTESIETHLDGKTPEQHTEALREQLDGELTYYKQTLDPEGLQLRTAEVVAQTGRSFLRDHPIGTTMRVDINGDLYSAAITNIRSTHKGTGNPYSLSKFNVLLATNGPMRTIVVPGTQLQKIEAARMYDQPGTLFRIAKTDSRETAKIITGNLLAAFGELKDTRGTIINFTKQDGTTEQGILLPKKFEFKENTKGDYRLRDASHALKFLRKSVNPRIEDIGIASRDGNVRVVNDGGKLTVITPKAKARSGKYFLDHAITDLTGDFVSQANTMRAAIPKGKETAVLNEIIRKAALYASPSMVEEAKSFAPKEEPKEKPESLLTGTSGAFTPAALSPSHIKQSYDDLIKSFIDKKLKLGDKYYKVKEYDPRIADTLHLVDNASRYFREKAKANLDKALKGLSDDQVRLAHLMVDSDSRDDLKTNHPDEYDQATQDPEVMAAVKAFEPLQREITRDRLSLGWPIRLSLHVEEDPSSANPFVVKDRQGNPVADFKTEGQAEKFVKANATVEPHLKRTYPEHSKNPLPGDTGAGPFTGSFYADKGLRPPKMDKKSREMSADYHYEHGRKDFSGYLESYAQTKEAVLKQHLFDELANEATMWKAGTAQPTTIKYNGKEYVRPDIALKARKGGQILEPYAVYDPSRGEKFLIKTPEWSTLTTGKPGIGPNDRYLAPKVVVDALERYDTDRGGSPSTLRKFFQEQIVGLFGPMVHVNNIIRHLGHATGLGAFDPRSWPSISRVILSPKLRERMQQGVDDATIDLLVKRGAYTSWSDIGSLNHYIGGNMNPLNWIRAFGKGVLFDPKFAGGWGGLDPKARVVIADYLKEHAGLGEQEIADTVNDALGNYNRSNWTERQKQLARFTLFPGWDTASAKWFLRHPFKVAIAGAMVVLAINLALKKLGKIKGDEAYDFAYIHFGDRKFRTGLISDSMGEHFAAPLLSAAEAHLKGDDVAAGATQGLMKGTSSLIGQFSGPTVEMIADQVYNRQYAGGSREIVQPQDRYTPGTWAPNRELEKRIAFATLKGLPAINRFLAPKGDLDAKQGLGSVVGVSNYKYGAEERLKSNAARAMTTSQTLSKVAETEPEAAQKFVEDPNKAVYLTFNSYLSEIEKDLKEIDTQRERVRLADMPTADRRAALESIGQSREQLLSAADSINDQISEMKMSGKSAQK